MKAVELKYKSFIFPLNNSFTNSNQSFTQKEIIILKVKDEKGNIAFGEVSPLPGFSNESMCDCINRLDNFSIDKIKSFDNPEKLNDEIKIFDNIPSLKFGIEQALIRLLTQNNLEYFKNRIVKKSIKVNGSIGIESLVETELQIDKFLEDEISTIKLKIGRTNFDDDFSILKMIKQKFKDIINLRLDVNGKWNYEEAKTNLKELEQFDLQYVEQPIKDKFKLLKLAKQSKIKIAPDESIQTFDDATDFINSGVIDFIILKPTIRLGIFETINLIKLAEQKNVTPIITTSFETAVGRSMLISLAGMTNHNFAHGLGFEVLGNCSSNSVLKSMGGEIKLNPNYLKFNFDDLWNRK